MCPPQVQATWISLHHRRGCLDVVCAELCCWNGPFFLLCCFLVLFSESFEAFADG